MTSVVRLLQLVCVLTLALAVQGTVTVLNATESFQYFTSPNYPSDYPSYQDLFWRIFTDIPGKVVEVDVVDSRLERSRSCAFDYVQIYDGTDSDASRIKEFCGTSTPDDVQASGQHMYIHFHSDGSAEYRGFRIRYSAESPSKNKAGLIVGSVLGALVAITVIGCITCAAIHASKTSKPRVRPNNTTTIAMTNLSGCPANSHGNNYTNSYPTNYNGSCGNSSNTTNNNNTFFYGQGQGWTPPPPGGGAVPPPVYYLPPYSESPPSYDSLGFNKDTSQENTGAPVSGGAPPEGGSAPPYPPHPPQGSQPPQGYPPSAPSAAPPSWTQPPPPQTAPPPPGSHPRPITAGFGNTPPAATEREEY